MRLAKWRQLLPVLAALAPRLLAAEPALEEALLAARARAATLALRADASDEEWRALEREFAALAARHPRSAPARAALGDFLWERDERARATAQWEEAAKLDPKNAAVWSALANARLAVGRVKDAVDCFSRAIAAEPANPLHHYHYANTALLFRREIGPSEAAVAADALAHFTEASRLAPHDARFALAHAEAYYIAPQPDWRAALAAWERVLAMGSDPDFALCNLARVHLQLGETAAARQRLDKVQGKERQNIKNRIIERIEALESAEEHRKRTIDAASRSP